MEAGDEVSGLIVRMLLDGCRKRGIDTARLIAGLPFPPRPGRERYSWDDFAELDRRVASALGGPWKLAAFLREQVSLDPRLRSIAGLFLSPRLLYLYLPERMTTRMFWNVGARVEELPDGRIRFEIRIPERYRPSTEFFLGSVGTAEGLPLLVGHPPGKVDAEVSGHHAIFLIHPPPSRTLGGRIARILPQQMVDDPELLEEAMEMGLGHRHVAEVTGRLGRPLVEAADRDAIDAALVSIVRERFLSRYLAVVEPGGDTRVLLREGPGVPVTRIRRLEVGERSLGHIELDLPGTGDSGAIFEALVPWLSLALDRLGAKREDEIERRLGAAIASWHLTPRQAQALEGIVRGRSNRQLAQEMGTAVKTVELHVGLLFKKSGCDGRTALLSSFFRDLPA